MISLYIFLSTYIKLVESLKICPNKENKRILYIFIISDILNFSHFVGSYGNSYSVAVSRGDMLMYYASRFEPCGLGQIIALRYGTIPVVRGTGGLLDTVKDYTENNKNGNGFIFHEFSKVSLLDALLRAITLYEDNNAWRKLISRAMKEDFSWRKSGRTYKEIYQKLLT